MNNKRFLLFLIVFANLFQSVFAQNFSQLPTLSVEEYRLKNGLRVILHEDKSTPVVAVNVWYHVGSKNEEKGRTGFAHLFEHLMFQGSKNYNFSYHTPLEEAGASRKNGITTQDTTNYFQVVPSNFLELALFMESDRMGGLLEVMTPEKLEIEKDVVKNERREAYENPPYGTWLEKVYAEIYPPEHPYRWHPIGSMKDISAATLDDVKSFFKSYYVPNNAILSIAGDFDKTKTKKWVEKYFGKIAKGAEIKRPQPIQPQLNGEIRKTVEENVPLPRLYLAWHIPPEYASGQAEIEMLSNILTVGRSSRLQNNLVFGKQIAQSVVSFSIERELGGLFFIQATPQAGKSLDELEKEITAELEKFQTEPPTSEEIKRALNQIENNKIFGMQTVLDVGDELAEYALYLNKPDSFQADIERYQRVTAANLQNAATKYLSKNRLVLSYIPQKNPPASAQQTSDNPPAPVQKKIDAELLAKQTANLPKPGPNPKLSLPPIEKLKLSNGLEVWLVKNNKLPIVSMNLVIKSGIAAEPKDKLGIAALTNNLMRTGTKNRSATEISNQLQSLGTAINSNLGWDSVTLSLQTLSKNFDQVLDIYADVTVSPTFPESELENRRRRTLSFINEDKSSPNEMVNSTFFHVLYGNQNPYSRRFFGTEESVKTISQNDLLEFHQTNYRPNNAVLIIVGQVEKNSLIPKLEKAFSHWKPQKVTQPEIPQSVSLTQNTIFLLDRPGAAQSTIRIGQISAPRNTPDYYSMQVINSLLGFGINSRLNANLRESKGYAYSVGSDFVFFKNAGHFVAFGDVQTAVTKEAVFEFMKELKGIQSDIPITAKELENTKQSIIRRFPAGFEGVGQISFQLSNSAIYGLSDSYFNEYIPKIENILLTEANQTAKKYFNPNRMAIVIVGDRKIIEPRLKQLGYEIQILEK
jgi:zinc protease